MMSCVSDPEAAKPNKPKEGSATPSRPPGSFTNHSMSGCGSPVSSEVQGILTLPVKTEPACFMITTRTRIELCDVKDSKEHVTFSQIGGLHSLKAEIKAHILSRSLPVLLVRTVLLCGPTGCGKSLLLSSVAGEAAASGVRTVSISRSQLDPAYLSSHGAEFGLGTGDEKVVILIDGLDSVVGSQKESGQLTESAAKISDALCQFMDGLTVNVQCLASARNPDRLDMGLRRRFDMELEVPVPSAAERREILTMCMQELRCQTSDDEGVGKVADSAHGFTGSDLSSLCKVAKSKSRVQLENQEVVVLSPHHLREAMRSVRASAMREITLEVPKISWSEVGGQEELKLELKQAVEWPLRHPDAFDRLGIQPPSGILLFGPPGCSKTLIARAVATESGLNFLAVKGPELFSKWVGESEKAVRELFRRARQASPSVIFFDEIDALSASRGSGGSGVGDRVLTQLLTEMDGVEGRGKVTVIAATNRPDVMDRALLRPGRLDRVIYVSLPDSGTRRDIFKIQLNKIPAENDLDMDFLVQKTLGYSGAEIVSLCREAALSAMRQDMNSSTVGTRYFYEALNRFTPRTDPKLLKAYDEFLESNRADTTDIKVEQ